MSDLSLPPNYSPVVPVQVHEEIKLVKLAREIAMDVTELDQILKTHNVEPLEFEEIKRNPRFQRVLEAEVVAWNTAVNTNERVKLKAGSMLEEWLPELYSRMNDPRENLLAKIKGGELVARLADMGQRGGAGDGQSLVDRVSITINLGDDKKLEFDKRLPPKVIDNNEFAPTEDADVD